MLPFLLLLCVYARPRFAVLTDLPPCMDRLNATRHSFNRLHFVHGHFSADELVKLNETGTLLHLEEDFFVSAQAYEEHEEREDENGALANSTFTASKDRLATQLYPPSWGMARISQRKLPIEPRFTFPSSAGEGVDVYVVDSGVNLDHVDLQGRGRFGTSTIHDEDVHDHYGHGSFVAGQIAGSQFGVAKRANIIAVKALNHRGIAPISKVVKGLHWVIGEHTKRPGRRSIVNISIDAPYSAGFNAIIGDAQSLGILVVVASGNGHKGRAVDACERSPASSEAVAVGAVDMTDQKARFSNDGGCVALHAPGVKVKSISHKNNYGTRTLSGTSFAGPYVSGVAALVMADTNMTIAEIKDFLVQMATPVDVGGRPGTPQRLLYV